MKEIIRKYFDIRILSLLSIVILFLPFVNILTTEIKIESIGEEFSNSFIYKDFTGFELFKEVWQGIREDLSALILLSFFILIILQFLLSFFKSVRTILIVSIILILMTFGIYILIKMIDPNSTILFGFYLFGINQLLIYYRT